MLKSSNGRSPVQLGKAGVGGFSPAQVGNLAVWLDAQDNSTITVSSNRVSQWNNKGNQSAGNAAQATANLKPLYVASAINGLPAIQFFDDGTNKELDIADGAALKYSTFSAFCVFQRVADQGTIATLFGKFTTTTNQREFRIISDDAAGGGDQFGMLTSATGGATAVGTDTTSTLISNGVPFIGDGFYDGSNQSVSILNQALATLPQTAVFNGTGVFSIGCINAGVTQPFAGYIGECLFYTTKLSTEARLRVLRYLSKKWGIAIS